MWRISFGMAILPTSCSRAANSSSWQLVLVHAQLLRHAARQFDDGTGVLGGVVVVELDDVDEQHHGAAVGAVQLERRGPALAAVAREDREQPDERGDRKQDEWLLDRREGDEEGHAGQDRGDPVGPGAELDHLPDRLAVKQAIAGERPREVAERGGGERQQVDPDVIERGLAGREGGEHEHRADAEPGVADARDPAIAGPRPAGVVRERREYGRERREQRDEVERREEKQRNEDELLRRHVQIAVLESDTRHNRVAQDEADHQEDVRVAFVGDEDRDGGGGREEQQCGRAVDHALAHVHSLLATLARLPDEVLVLHHQPHRPDQGVSNRPPNGNAHLSGANLHGAHSFLGDAGESCTDRTPLRRCMWRRGGGVTLLQ